MKKFISVIIALIISTALCVPAFAAEKANFIVNVLSEDDSQALVSIDYNGGQSFNCLDFEVKLSENVSVKDCSNGAGLRNFIIYSLDMNVQPIVIFNKDSNPIKFSFASTLKFKVVNGKDILTLNLNKKSAAKLTADDIKLTVTNCGIIADNDTVNVKVNAVQIGNSENVTTLKAPNQVGTAEEKTGEPASLGETSSATQEATLGGEDEITLSSDSQAEPTPDESNDDTQSTASDKRKIIVIAAVSLCLVLVIAATVIYIVKKSKDSND